MGFQAQLLLLLASVALAAAATELSLPSYHYGAPIRVECMNRSSYVLYLFPLFYVLLRSRDGVGCCAHTTAPRQGSRDISLPPSPVRNLSSCRR